MRIAIFIRNLSVLAGIERVAYEQTRIFSAHGAECLLCGDAGEGNVLPVNGEARRIALERLLGDFRPDVFILHFFMHAGFEDDIAVCRKLGVKTVVVSHFSFPSPLLLPCDGYANIYRDFYAAAKKCDVASTVSAVDAQWWRGMGIRTLHVLNPFVHPAVNAGNTERHGEATVRHVLWVGRQSHEKQPELALSAFAEVLKQVPDAQLKMVGGANKYWKPMRKLANKLGIKAHVDFLAARKDLDELWDWADLHLLSSVTESFCLVLAEAKARGVPTVMFEIPFLELVQSGKGILVAPQGDTHALAQQMIRMMTEDGLCNRLGQEARDSIAPFNDNEVWESWGKVFKALETGEGGYEVSPEVRTIVSQMIFAWSNFCDRNLWAVQFVDEWRRLFHFSFKPIARCLFAIVGGIRRLKAYVRNVGKLA